MTRNERIDLILVDTDIPDDQRWLNQVLDILGKHSSDTTIMFTGVKPKLQVIKLMTRNNISGYVLKDEICYSLAWAVLFALDSRFVVTPGVAGMFDTDNPLPRGSLILDGRNHIATLDEKDTERARMAFMFSMERHELADELGIAEEYAYGVVSYLFEKIGLNDVLRGEVKPEDCFGSNPIVMAHIMQAIEEIQKDIEKAKEYTPTGKISPRKGKSKSEIMPKIKEKETLAFHLLTLPEIEQIS